MESQFNAPGRRCSGDRDSIAKIDTDILNLVEARQFLRCHLITIKRRAKVLHIPHKRLGSLWRFSHKALSAWMEEEDRKD